MEPPSRGSVTLDGVNPFELPEPELARFRNLKIGFVFQSYQLIPTLTAEENVLLPAELAGESAAYDSFTVNSITVSYSPRRFMR